MIHESLYTARQSCAAEKENKTYNNNDNNNNNNNRSGCHVNFIIHVQQQQQQSCKNQHSSNDTDTDRDDVTSLLPITAALVSSSSSSSHSHNKNDYYVVCPMPFDAWRCVADGGNNNGDDGSEAQDNGENNNSKSRNRTASKSQQQDSSSNECLVAEAFSRARVVPLCLLALTSTYISNEGVVRQQQQQQQQQSQPLLQLIAQPMVMRLPNERNKKAKSRALGKELTLLVPGWSSKDVETCVKFVQIGSNNEQQQDNHNNNDDDEDGVQFVVGLVEVPVGGDAVWLHGCAPGGGPCRGVVIGVYSTPTPCFSTSSSSSSRFPLVLRFRVYCTQHECVSVVLATDISLRPPPPKRPRGKA
eukprot:PhM_4_TR14031/c0_g1_i1/m.67815